MEKSKKILLSGIKPTGRIHLGNYYGAVRQFIDLQNSGDYEPFVFAATHHSLTQLHEGEKVAELTKELILDYLGAGLDPEKTHLFLQTHIPEVFELTWIFNCITTMPYLMRAHAYKDAEAKDKEINVGTFDYPMLMTADILAYGSEIVPVGKDQKQHVEFARDTAEKFNHIFGETFTIPDAYILEDVAVVPGTDGRKMSKSYHNTIPLFGSDEEITKAVMSVVTDSKPPEETKNPDEDNVFQLHKLMSSPERIAEIKKGYEAGGLGYKESKELLLDSVMQLVAPMRERRREYENDPAKLAKILEEGAAVARERAQETIKKVRKAVGVDPFIEA